MPRFFIGADDIHHQAGQEEILLQGEDFYHIVKVLRYQRGDLLVCCDGAGRDYHCIITEIDGGALKAAIQTVQASESEPKLKVTLYQALPKGDKMEQVIQKAVELGVSRITPVLSKRCVSRPKDGAKKVARWNKIARAAAEQCGRGIIPAVTEIIELPAAVKPMRAADLAAVCYENERQTSLGALVPKLRASQSFSFLVGPEGGLDPDEMSLFSQAEIASVSLGKRILRTETAAGCVLAVCMFATGDL